MHRLSRVLLVCVALAIAAVAAILVVSDIPSPLAKKEIVIPDERLPR